MRPVARLRSGGGWFAAGEQFERALRLLSDGAFKVFAYVCLHAERASGRLDFGQAELARSLGKSRSAVGRGIWARWSPRECARSSLHPTSTVGPGCRSRPSSGPNAVLWPAQKTADRRRSAGPGRARARPTWSACADCSPERPACRALSVPPTSIWQRNGTGMESPWRPSGVPSCSAVCASRSLLSTVPIRSRFAAWATSSPCWRRSAASPPILATVVASRRCEQHWQAQPASAPSRRREGGQQ